MNKLRLLLLLCVTLTNSPSHAMTLLGRLGIGMSSQLVTGMETLSFKLQRNRSSAVGGILGLNSNSDATNYAIGGKYYRIIYDEPQLNFYTSASLATFSYQDSTSNETKNGHQIEAGFGTEFSFQGLESIGFSFEFGAGYSYYNEESIFKTIGHDMITSAIHFYL